MQFPSCTHFPFPMQTIWNYHYSLSMFCFRVKRNVETYFASVKWTICLPFSNEKTFLMSFDKWDSCTPNLLSTTYSDNGIPYCQIAAAVACFCTAWMRLITKRVIGYQNQVNWLFCMNEHVGTNHCERVASQCTTLYRVQTRKTPDPCVFLVHRIATLMSDCLFMCSASVVQLFRREKYWRDHSLVA